MIMSVIHLFLISWNREMVFDKMINNIDENYVPIYCLVLISPVEPVPLIISREMPLIT
jgi:hypothetical protein